MYNLIEIFLSSLAIFLFFYFVYLVISLVAKNKKLFKMLVQAEVERDHFRKKLSEQMANKDNKKLEQTDGFVRFISQSREWAFDYIEKVQESIKNLEKTRQDFSVDKETIFKDIVVSKNFNELLNSVDKIIEHLPNDNEEK